MNNRHPLPPATTVIKSIMAGYWSYRQYFHSITDRALDRFVQGDWKGMQADAIERLEAYQKILDHTVHAIRADLGPQDRGQDLWASAKGAIAPEIDRKVVPPPGGHPLRIPGRHLNPAAIVIPEAVGTEIDT